jgi:hypothetical protein
MTLSPTLTSQRHAASLAARKLSLEPSSATKNVFGRRLFVLTPFLDFLKRNCRWIVTAAASVEGVIMGSDMSRLAQGIP